MLSITVYKICAASGGYKGCPGCPLWEVCGMPHEEMQGETLAEKTAYWEARMNQTAKEVEL